MWELIFSNPDHQKINKMSERQEKIGEWEQMAKQAAFKPDTMAALYGCSRRQLERIFDEQLQTTPGCWLRELQCRLAKELVSQGWSNKAIAAELKFANESSFCKKFNKIYGVSPQTYAPRWNPPRNVAN